MSFHRCGWVRGIRQGPLKTPPESQVEVAVGLPLPRRMGQMSACGSIETVTGSKVEPRKHDPMFSSLPTSL
ncbi:MAG: hypothetical protein WCY78_07425, partial [Sphaerochaetaceae bacterium]